MNSLFFKLSHRVEARKSFRVVALWRLHTVGRIYRERWQSFHSARLTTDCNFDALTREVGIPRKKCGCEKVFPLYSSKGCGKVVPSGTKQLKDGWRKVGPTKSALAAAKKGKVGTAELSKVRIRLTKFAPLTYKWFSPVLCLLSLSLCRLTWKVLMYIRFSFSWSDNCGC